MTNTQESLKLLSKIWGNREGYVFLPWIDGDATEENRKSKYHEGRAFDWPKEKGAIKAHLEKHVDDDLYFCPNLFLEKKRSTDVAAEERALWADLDEMNPEDIEDELRPTIAWESSPGRYQAIWLLTEDALLASEAGGLGQRLTYHVGADKGGWDSTQLLRPPGWRNHKPGYREKYGEAPQGKLLWGVGPRYEPAEIDEAIPELTASEVGSLIGDILEQEIESIRRPELLARIRSKLPVKVKRLIDARDDEGRDRSTTLFYIEQSLAEVGCTISEVVAIVRPTVWNKFAGRNDELKRLQIEASKAIEKARTKPSEEDSDFEVVEGLKEPSSLWEMVANVKSPNWLIEDLWTQDACGVIAGGPKSMKSWFALDMAISIATGEDCLGYFKVNNPGPVLYIQEEDGLPEIKRRISLITQGRDDLGKYHPHSHMTKVDGQVYWGPSQIPPIFGLVREGLMLSTPEVMEWLDEQLSKRVYRALFLDPLMQLHDTEENRYGEITTRFLKPLKQLSEKYKLAIILIHHTNKADPAGKRIGARLLGSQAVHAWTEDLLVLDKDERKNIIQMSRESKFAGEKRLKFRSTFRGDPQHSFERQANDSKSWWVDMLEDNSVGGNEGEGDEGKVKEEKLEGAANTSTYRALVEMGSGAFTPAVIAEQSGMKVQTVRVQLTALKKEGLVENASRGHWALTSRGQRGVT